MPREESSDVEVSSVVSRVWGAENVSVSNRLRWRMCVHRVFGRLISLVIYFIFDCARRDPTPRCEKLTATRREARMCMWACTCRAARAGYPYSSFFSTIVSLHSSITISVRVAAAARRPSPARSPRPSRTGPDTRPATVRHAQRQSALGFAADTRRALRLRLPQPAHRGRI